MGKDGMRISKEKFLRKIIVIGSVSSLNPHLKFLKNIPQSICIFAS
jgi:hypothetical protein